MSVDLKINESFHPELKKFIQDVYELVNNNNDEEPLTKGIASLLKPLLQVEGFLNKEYLSSDPQKIADSTDYMVYVAPDSSFSILSCVWAVGQSSPVHDHCTWGVVGVVQGMEIETHYYKPIDGKEEVLKPKEVHFLQKGDVLVCCTKDDDIHDVRSGHVGEPCVGFHVYGGNIKDIKRHVYDPITGKRKLWDELEIGSL